MRRWEIDEDAFYNRTSTKRSTRKPRAGEKEDDLTENNLAKKLGLDEDVLEQAKKLQEEKDKMKKDKKYAKAKKEQEVKIHFFTF